MSRGGKMAARHEGNCTKRDTNVVGMPFFLYICTQNKDTDCGKTILGFQYVDEGKIPVQSTKDIHRCGFLVSQPRRPHCLRWLYVLRQSHIQPFLLQPQGQHHRPVGRGKGFLFPQISRDEVSGLFPSIYKHVCLDRNAAENAQ